MNAPADNLPLAVALTYDGSSAPRVVAKGAGELAEKIIATAQQHGVPLQPDLDLVRLLAQLDLGDEIPETLYRCVAQIIAFAYRLRGRYPRGWSAPQSGAGASAAAPPGWPELPSAGTQISEP